MRCFWMLTILLAGWLPGAHAVDIPWEQDTIDRGARGAAGFGVGDVNGDGLPDVVCAWRESEATRVYLHPGHEQVWRAWPFVEVGGAPGVQDAAFVDLDGDGATDVVAAGADVRLHFAPADPFRFLDPVGWTTLVLPDSSDVMAHARVLPMQVDGLHGPDLVVGGVGEGAAVGWWEAPEDPRDIDAWRWHPLAHAGHIHTLLSVDMDHDGDDDLLVSDGEGLNAGVRWLENPGPGTAQTKPWPMHWVGDAGRATGGLTLADLNGDGLPEVVAVAPPEGLRVFERDEAGWRARVIALDARGGTPVAVAAADLDEDGRDELVLTLQDAEEGPGVLALHMDQPSRVEDIAGPRGVGFGRPALLDLDGDGDLDVLTTEFESGLGLTWYANPLRETCDLEGLFRAAEPEVFDATLVEQWASDNAAQLAWGASQTMKAYLYMFEATGDTYYLDRFLLLCDRVWSVRADRLGIVPRGYDAPVPAWTSTTYSQGVPEVEQVLTAMIAFPPARMVRAIRERIPDQPALAAYDATAELYLTLVEETMAVHEDTWRNGPYDDEGYYVVHGAEMRSSLNRIHSLGRVLLELYVSTGKAEYLDKVERLANYFKRRLTRLPNGAVDWGHFMPDPLGRPPTDEDISHAASSVDFVALCAQEGIVFTAEDVQGFVTTFADVMYQGEGDFASTVAGNIWEKRWGLFTAMRWGRILQFDPRPVAFLRPRVCEQAQRSQRPPLAIPYLLLAQP